MMQHLIRKADEIEISPLIRRAIASIQQVVGTIYDEKQIEKACKEIAAGVEVSSIDESEFTQQVFARLQAGKTRKPTPKTRKKRNSHEDMLQSILDGA